MLKQMSEELGLNKKNKTSNETSQDIKKTIPDEGL